jgi:hypothetical protein
MARNASSDPRTIGARITLSLKFVTSVMLLSIFFFCCCDDDTDTVILVRRMVICRRSTHSLTALSLSLTKRNNMRSRRGWGWGSRCSRPWFHNEPHNIIMMWFMVFIWYPFQLVRARKVRWTDDQLDDGLLPLLCFLL